jgi:CRP/FNR family transcriptional regulator
MLPTIAKMRCGDLMLQSSMSAARPSVVVPLRPATVCVKCEQRAISVCNTIPDEDLHRLTAAATTIVLQAGQGFIEEGDQANFFYNITAGTARMLKSMPDGRRQITGFAAPGAFLGLAAQTHYSFGAEALEPMRVCRFSRSALAGLMEDFAGLEHRLLEIACSELVLAQEHMLLLGRKTARERLASFLLARGAMSIDCALAPRFNQHRLVALPMSRSDIADYLGLTIETVSRTLTRLKADSLIALPDAHSIDLLNPARLKMIADGNFLNPIAGSDF